MNPSRCIEPPRHIGNRSTVALLERDLEDEDVEAAAALSQQAELGRGAARGSFKILKPEALNLRWRARLSQAPQRRDTRPNFATVAACRGWSQVNACPTEPSPYVTAIVAPPTTMLRSVARPEGALPNTAETKPVTASPIITAITQTGMRYRGGGSKMAPTESSPPTKKDSADATEACQGLTRSLRSMPSSASACAAKASRAVKFLGYLTSQSKRQALLYVEKRELIQLLVGHVFQLRSLQAQQRLLAVKLSTHRGIFAPTHR